MTHNKGRSLCEVPDHSRLGGMKLCCIPGYAELLTIRSLYEWKRREMTSRD